MPTVLRTGPYRFYFYSHFAASDPWRGGLFMRHFIAYHNTEKMGRRLHEGQPLGLVTNKPVEQLLHNTVWFITGESSSPRQYCLGSVFRVAEVGDTGEDEFAHYASGPGHAFELPIPVNDLEWFPEVFRSTGHFGLGVQEVKDEAVIAALIQLAADAGHRTEDGDQIRLPEEVPNGSTYSEGSVQQILVNRYERDPRAREECIRHYGATCFLCGFEFLAEYGEVMAGFIHVHHLRPLSGVGPDYQVDPVQDLRPVCPNCHAVLHRREPPYSLEEVRQFLQARRRGAR
jgi:hypothetical protein